jgi:peptidoglycan/LPS O-acetylase OafA/YrhL
MTNTLNRVFTSQDSLVEPERNNWNLIRLILAFLVVYGHSYALFKNRGEVDFLAKYLARNISYSGEIAVVCFFFVSGLLVTQSIIKSQSPQAFLIHRFFRIFPALFVLLLFSISIVIPVISDHLALKSSLKYLLLNSSLVTNDYSVGSVFANNHYPSVVNGSLWTLPNEVRCYVFILVIVILCSYLNRLKIALILIICIFYLVYQPLMVPFIGSNNLTSGNTLYVTNSIFFLLGCLACIGRLGKLSSFVLLILSFATYGFWTLHRAHHLIFFLFLVLLISGITNNRYFCKIRINFDISYGVYLYGFLLEQTIAHYFPNMTPLPGFFVSSIFTTIVALISWGVVEKRCIRLAKKLSLRFEAIKTNAS